jgi:hypothetical protein
MSFPTGVIESYILERARKVDTVRAKFLEQDKLSLQLLSWSVSLSLSGSVFYALCVAVYGPGPLPTDINPFFAATWSMTLCPPMIVGAVGLFRFWKTRREFLNFRVDERR